MSGIRILTVPIHLKSSTLKHQLSHVFSVNLVCKEEVTNNVGKKSANDAGPQQGHDKPLVDKCFLVPAFQNFWSEFDKMLYS